jgi:threonine/homoserine/homoserine lactone efflux protein
MTLLAKLLAPAVAIALSPIPVAIVLILLVHNDRPRTSSIAYLLGRAIALTASVVVMTSTSSLYIRGRLPGWTDLAAAAIGVGVIAAGLRTWRQRDRAPMDPRWHRHVGGIQPRTSATIGLLPPLVNPKVIAASVAAGTQISAQTSPVAAIAALASYIAVATSTITAPILIYLLAGSRIDSKLERVRSWIALRHNETTALTLIAIGLAILIYGLV